MDEQIQSHNCFKWSIRFLSYLVMVLGICFFFAPITTLLGYVPLLGGILQAAVGIVIFVAALLICLPIWLLVFAVAWLIYHPKVGAIFLGLALLATGLVLFLTLHK